jgi:acyl-coenzyme A thioesterase PaaI-like protein
MDEAPTLLYYWHMLITNYILSLSETIVFFPMMEFIVSNSYMDQNVTNNSSTNVYQSRLREISSSYHASCIFKHNPPIRGLQFLFNDSGELTAEFTCDASHQGYDSMVHGGIIAAIIDASMAQCLMGHGVVAYTAELKVRYKHPLKINHKVKLITNIESSYLEKLYKMNTTIHQDGICKVVASSSFIAS